MKMLLKKQIKIDAPVSYPQTLIEAKDLIRQTFAENRWDRAEIKRYLNFLGLNKNFDELEKEEIKTIVEDLKNSKMILFKEKEQ